MNRKDVYLSLHHARLLMGYAHQTLTAEEGDEIEDWIVESDTNGRMYDEIMEIVNSRLL